MLSNSEGALQNNKDLNKHSSLKDITQTRKHSTSVITIQNGNIQRFAFNFIAPCYYKHKYIFQYKGYFDTRIRILTT